MSKTISLQPRLNEKTYGLASSNVYVFDVDRSVNKHSIARAVEAQFDVEVVSVNTTNIPGKSKRTISINGKRMLNAEGSRNDFKKAYVTLARGNALPFFDAIEEEEQKEEATQSKIDKVAEKQAAKEEKKSASKTAKVRTTTKAKAAKPLAKAEAPKEEPAPAEKPAHKSAWRGFRLRKKNKDGDK